MAYDRYRAIQSKNRPNRRKGPPKSAQIIAALVWVIGISVAAPVFIKSDINDTGENAHCYENWADSLDDWVYLGNKSFIL